MATSFEFSNAMDGVMPVTAAVPAAVESVTPGGTSAQTTITAKRGQVCTINSDVAIWVSFGANPTAASGTGILVQPFQLRTVGFLQDGWKVAYITA